MGIGVSIFLIAVGAILTFAVEAEVSGLDIAVVGVILMIVGGLGLLATMMIFGPRRREMVAGGQVVSGGPVVTERTVTRDEY